MDYINYKGIEPDNTNLYDNGTPFDKPELVYNNIVAMSIPYLKDKQPVLPIIIGGQSSGKTTLGTHIGDIYNFFYGKGLVNLKDKQNPQYSQGGTEFLHKLPICAKEGYPFHQWDESGKYSRKNSLTSFNKNMDEAVDVLRVHQVAIAVIRHDISRLPKEIIEHEIAGILIRCKQRKPGSGYVEAEVYDFESICYLIYYLKNAVAPQHIFNRKVYPCFHFRFKDLSPERSMQLDMLSSKKKLEMWDQKDIKQQGLLTIEEISYRLHKSIIWIRTKIKEMNIEPKLVNKKKHYYSQEIINKLEYKIKRS